MPCTTTLLGFCPISKSCQREAVCYKSPDVTCTCVCNDIKSNEKEKRYEKDCQKFEHHVFSCTDKDSIELFRMFVMYNANTLYGESFGLLAWIHPSKLVDPTNTNVA